MNFAGHLAGGVAAGAASVAVAATLPAVPVPGAVGPLSGEAALLAGCFLTAFFMALFPDLDIASVPQRWFLRVMFAALAGVLLLGRLDLFVVLAFAALLPLIHRHRGWTHWKVTPWAISLFLASAQEYLATRDAWFRSFSPLAVWDALGRYWPFVFACVAGHYTHLVLDSRRLKWLPFIRNAADHH